MIYIVILAYFERIGFFVGALFNMLKAYKNLKKRGKNYEKDNQHQQRKKDRRRG